MLRAFADPTLDPRNAPYQPFGVAEDLLYDQSDQIILCGPSGTGKSRACLEKLHLICSKYAGTRALMVRKTRASLTQSAMVTFEKMVVPQNDSVSFRTGEQEYRYVNGSVIAVGGMDKAIKIMSTEYDIIYVQEATELSEEDWETLTTRARFGRVPYNQVIGDCNPSFPFHWIKRKSDRGELKLYNSRHEDNPVLFNQILRDWTPKGRAYLAKLEKLSGVRFKRLRLGIWAAAEGMIYTEYDSNVHLLDRFPIPAEWDRYWVVDFGFTNPFVWQAWAIDPEGRAYRFAEIYRTQLLVEDAAAMISAWRRENSELPPAALICDHDAEDRATLERHLNLTTEPAIKNVSGGIQTVKERLRIREDGKARMYFLRDSVWDVDEELVDAMKPYSTEQEFDAYEWADSRKRDEPKKVDDHGMDCTRYLSVHLDNFVDAWSMGMSS